MQVEKHTNSLYKVIVLQARDQLMSYWDSMNGFGRK